MAWTEKYVTPGGTEAWATNSSSLPSSYSEAAANVAAGERVNIKAGTYTITTAISWSAAGTTDAPIWLRGYKTSIGDMDAEPTTQRVQGTDIPLIDHTANYSFLTTTADHYKVSNLSFRSSVTSRPALYCYTNTAFTRCRFEHTKATGTDSVPMIFSTDSYRQFHNCWFKAASSSSDLIVCDNLHNWFEDCVFQGGQIGLRTTNGIVNAVNCVFNGNGSHGVQSSDGNIHLRGCTFYNPGGDGVRVTNVAVPGRIVRCYFHTIGGYAINNTNAIDSSLLMIRNNCYYNLTSGQLNGIDESQQWDALTDSVDRFTDKANDDFTLVSSSSGYGLSRLIENTGPTCFFDVGAIGHEDAGGGTVIVIED
jgi:hypothetical protein